MPNKPEPAVSIAAHATNRIRALCIVLPGALLLRRLHPDVGPLEALCVGGALGLFAVPYLAFVPAYALGLFLNAGLVVGAAAVLVFALRTEARAAWLDRLGLDRLDRRGATHARP